MDGLGKKQVGRLAEPLAADLSRQVVARRATKTPSPGRVWTIPSRSKSV